MGRKVYSSMEVIQLLKLDGWDLDRVAGSHYQFIHYRKRGTVTVPHPKQQIGKGLLNKILKQAQMKEEEII